MTEKVRKTIEYQKKEKIIIHYFQRALFIEEIKNQRFLEYESSTLQFVVFKPLSYCLKETMRSEK